ncbi:hypothetical protein AB0N07_38535 [Streptomyces sp. NPDC051172]
MKGKLALGAVVGVVVIGVVTANAGDKAQPGRRLLQDHRLR